jgi:hypothetical protein
MFGLVVRIVLDQRHRLTAIGDFQDPQAADKRLTRRRAQAAGDQDLVFVGREISEVRGLALLPHREHTLGVFEDDDPTRHDQAAWVIDGGLGSAVACLWAASC